VQHCSESGIDPVDERKQKERARPEMVEEEGERVATCIRASIIIAMQ
jgi:hypothetical protein